MIMVNGQAMVNEGVIWYSAHISPIVPPPLSIYLTVFIAFNINNIIVIIDLQQVFYCKIEESSSSSPNKEWQNGQRLYIVIIILTIMITTITKT